MIKAANLFLLLICCLASSSGCKSGMLGNRSLEWKRPDLSRMAFWRKESDEIPKPPALHFEPTPTEDQRIARQAAQPEPLLAGNESRQNTTPSGDSTGAPKSSSSKALEDLSHLADNLGNRPIRTPYQVTSEDSSSSDQTRVASFNNDSSSETARSDFLAAMNSVQPAGGSSGFAAPAGFTADTPDTPASQADVRPASNPLFNQLPSAPQPKPESAVSSAGASSAGFDMNSPQMAVTNPSDRSLQPVLQPVLQPIHSDSIPVAPSLSSSSSTGDRDFLPLAVTPAANGSNTNANSSFAPAAQSSFSSLQPQDFSSRAHDLSVAARPDPIRSPAQPAPSVGISAESGNPGIPFNQRARNFANDVDIPESVLQRQGSFAPGSLQSTRNFY